MTQQQQREYKKFLRTTQWMVQRARVIVRSNGICEICHKSRVKQVHHRRYCADIASTPDSDLLALCGRCHKNAHVAGFNDGRHQYGEEIRLF